MPDYSSGGVQMFFHYLRTDMYQQFQNPHTFRTDDYVMFLQVICSLMSASFFKTDIARQSQLTVIVRHDFRSD
jgi:hypothetical protein